MTEKIISIVNHKGVVGRTTTAANIGAGNNIQNIDADNTCTYCNGTGHGALLDGSGNVIGYGSMNHSQRENHGKGAGRKIYIELDCKTE